MDIYINTHQPSWISLVKDGLALLALDPEAIAFTAWCAQRADEKHILPIGWSEWLGYDQHDGDRGEPPSQSFINVSLTLLLAVLSYHVKDVRALSTVYDEAFVLSPPPPSWLCWGGALQPHRGKVAGSPSIPQCTHLMLSSCRPRRRRRVLVINIAVSDAYSVAFPSLLPASPYTIKYTLKSELHPCDITSTTSLSSVAVSV
jgi:hypothetical protein